VVPRNAADPSRVQRVHRSRQLERYGRRYPRHIARTSDDADRPENYLNQFKQPLFNSTEFLVIGYGTEVRGNPPTAERQPIVRRFTTEIGQWLGNQVFQTNANENDPRAGGGTCFGDSGGPSIMDGFIVGDPSYGLTTNCRYIRGYQLVDIPVVRNSVLDCVADPICPSKVS
jgi:hypothetical protein